MERVWETGEEEERQGEGETERGEEELGLIEVILGGIGGFWGAF